MVTFALIPQPSLQQISIGLSLDLCGNGNTRSKTTGDPGGSHGVQKRKPGPRTRLIMPVTSNATRRLPGLYHRVPGVAAPGLGLLFPCNTPKLQDTSDTRDSNALKTSVELRAFEHAATGTLSLYLTIPIASLRLFQSLRL